MVNLTLFLLLDGSLMLSLDFWYLSSCYHLTQCGICSSTALILQLSSITFSAEIAHSPLEKPSNKSVLFLPLVRFFGIAKTTMMTSMIHSSNSCSPNDSDLSLPPQSKSTIITTTDETEHKIKQKPSFKTECFNLKGKKCKDLFS